jgi:predicted peptidase
VVVPGYTTATQAPGAPTETAGKGPFLWLDFEANSISGGVIDNIAGDGLNAVISGEPQYITSPTGGSAIYFGKGNTFDYLTIANDEKLNFSTTDEFTIDFWYMRETQNNTWENLFSKGLQKSGYTGGWYGVWLSTNDNSNGGICWGGDTTNHKIASKNLLKEWQHITVIQKSGFLYLYLNGEFVKSVTAKNYNSTTDFFIGGMNSSYSAGGTAQSTILQGQFHGAIDDFKIYDYAWEKSESNIYEAEADVYEYVNTTTNKKISLPYRVYYPTDFDGNTNKYPVLLFLHGHGECGNDNSTQLQVFGPNILLNDIVDMNNCIIVAPQTYCDSGMNYAEWVASGVGADANEVHIWDKTGMPIRPGTLDETIHTMGMQAAEALIKEFIADSKNRVDTNRVYVAGISMGGCGTWEIMARNPDLFAAGIPLCGSGILSTADKLVNIDIWAFHGTKDPTVLPEGTTKMVDAIKAAGGTKIIYTALSGQGHSIWNPAYTYTNAAGQTPAQWLLQQTKAD